MALGNIHLTPDLVQAVRDAVDIVDVASEYTRLKKAGRRYQGLCPLHKEKTPSFSVDPDQGFYYCFGCGQGGDAIKLHMLLSGDDFPGGDRECWPGVTGFRCRAAPAAGPQGRDQISSNALEEAEKFFRRSWSSAEKPRRYLDERKISDDCARCLARVRAADGG